MNAITTADVATAEPVRFPDGIHFGIQNEPYQADDAIGSTKSKELVIDPIEYQHARLHGGEKRETMALKWGNAIHCRVLEGRASLAERFPIEPALADYIKPLVTFEDLKRHCRLLSLTPGKSKEETIQRIREVDEEVVIWDMELAKFKAETAGKTTLPRDALEHIERAAKWMQQNPKLAPVMQDGTINAGASEVSIFWTEAGVRLKARLDHLLAHAVIDLKSFRPFYQENIKESAKKAISRMRYDLQAAHYMRALHAAAKLYAEGKVFGNPYPAEFLETVFKTLAAGKMKWVWVLIKASGAPQSVVRELDMSSMIFKTAAADIGRAIDDYREMVAKFGVDNDWMPDLPAEILGDGDFSPYAFT